ncbi:DUF218 domain-containing protein [Williamsia sterculiae]|uniref:DUF218 domain-containing protein n=2 Tax=Williamsia sterculiae TaxID=1344003 RepID=A0A1N7CZL3_9NOCA|nr:DUF218 domain-containing protein [Williamsia sterculiae]
MITVVVVIVAFPVILGISGYFLFTRADMDPLTKADAIIVLGGEHDGREDYGLDLARQGYAPVVAMSDPYPAWDPVMATRCNAQIPGVLVMCLPPDPATTQGEAKFTQQLAKSFGWKKVIVITWRYHLPRSRYIFHQCFDGQVVMRGVPRRYDMGVLGWEAQYLYQTGAFVKAAILGC